VSWEIRGKQEGPDGTPFALYRWDDQYMIRAGGCELMSTRAHASEEALGRLVCGALSGDDPRVLVGGLGLGYTLRAVLDHLPRAARVAVAELVPAILDWHRCEVGACCGWPLRDPRVTTHLGDVAALLLPAAFDGIVLDVDNGPEALSWDGNRTLYSARGTAALRRALRPGGVLGVWSAEVDETYEDTLRRCGLAVRRLRVPARGAWDGIRHVVYLAQKTPAAETAEHG